MVDQSPQDLNQAKTEKNSDQFQLVLSEYDSRIDNAYKLAIKMRLPEDLDIPETEEWKFGLESIPIEKRDARLKQLNLKLLEYEERLQKSWEKQSAGDLDTNNSSDRYKRDVLRLVLKHGQVSPRLIVRTYQPDPDNKDALENMANAFGVIQNYIKTGGEGNKGGSGLPTIQ